MWSGKAQPLQKWTWKQGNGNYGPWFAKLSLNKNGNNKSNKLLWLFFAPTTATEHKWMNEWKKSKFRTRHLNDEPQWAGWRLLSYLHLINNITKSNMSHPGAWELHVCSCFFCFFFHLPALRSNCGVSLLLSAACGRAWTSTAQTAQDTHLYITRHSTDTGKLPFLLFVFDRFDNSTSCVATSCFIIIHFSKDHAHFSVLF